jgi:ankyrin repeat protein
MEFIHHSLPSFDSSKLPGLFSFASPALDLQNAIQSGNLSEIEKTLLQGSSINEPLPNGELPLHFDIRANAGKNSKALLELGANPMLKDFQGLSAIDHAILMKNDNATGDLLSYIVGKSCEEIKDEMRSLSSQNHFREITKRMTNLEQEAKKKNSIDPNFLNAQKHSLLHFAVVSENSKELVQQALALKVDPNLQNNLGETALHFACAKGDISAIGALIQNGADIHLKDHQGRSALALLGQQVLQKDPLALSSFEGAFFIFSSLGWLTSIAAQRGYLTLDPNVLGFLQTTLGALATFSSFGVFLQNFESNWTKAVYFLSPLFIDVPTGGFIKAYQETKLENLGTLVSLASGLSLQLWRTHYSTTKAFINIKACWNNLGYRDPLTIGRNLLVHTHYAVMDVNAV